MRRHSLTLPELLFIIGTRVMLGAGVGLLIAEKLDDERRRTIGLTLVGVGVLTTIPAALAVLRSGERHPLGRLREALR
jgi:hypothetical protein